MRTRQKSKQAQDGTAVDLAELLRHLATHHEPSRVIELYYWSREPDLTEVMRQFIALPQQAKKALRAFLHMATEDAGSVAVVVGPNGELTLSSPVVAELVKRLNVGADPAESLH
jgi:hypothetical protein